MAYFGLSACNRLEGPGRRPAPAQGASALRGGEPTENDASRFAANNRGITSRRQFHAPRYKKDLDDPPLALDIGVSTVATSRKRRGPPPTGGPRGGVASIAFYLQVRAWTGQRGSAPLPTHSTRREPDPRRTRAGEATPSSLRRFTRATNVGPRPGRVGRIDDATPPSARPTTSRRRTTRKRGSPQH